jgi:hypothetical protein
VSDEHDLPEFADADDDEAALSSVESLTNTAGSGPSPTLRATLLELMKYGLLESSAKPNLYRHAITQQAELADLLQWMDLRLRLDEIRGLAFLTVVAPDEGDDEWAHPLIRRQRLTLEQSLLVAILRQQFVTHEIESGVGAADARVALEDLQPHLQPFLGDPGSDAQERKRLLGLLEQLKGHGLVSEVDQHERVTIRPIIVHVANPENLSQLIHALRTLADAQGEPPVSDSDTSP